MTSAWSKEVLLFIEFHRPKSVEIDLIAAKEIVKQLGGLIVTMKRLSTRDMALLVGDFKVKLPFYINWTRTINVHEGTFTFTPFPSPGSGSNELDIQIIAALGLEPIVVQSPQKLIEPPLPYWAQADGECQFWPETTIMFVDEFVDQLVAYEDALARVKTQLAL
jgi:hypothetical protein